MHHLDSTMWRVLVTTAVQGFWKMVDKVRWGDGGESGNVGADMALWRC